MDFWYVYVLQSLKQSFRYVGISRNYARRLKLHNAGKVKSTKHYRPFKVIYVEKQYSPGEARKREKYLKSAAGRIYLKKVTGSPPD
ncbi:MAG: GIY-YIG nuclease family protein [FCB group bacterium]|nr:GIY-YIG nuclease family protein [FCB group bacterium]